MKYDENKNIEENEIKKEAGLVTKESISAVCALFSFMALLILCTRSLIFGEAGGAIHAFLTGVFGYAAYPLVLGALYLSVMSLIGKSLVRNRKAGLCVALVFVFALLIVHTACTYRWALDGYIQKCFVAGEQFPNATASGWLGGMLVYAVALLMSKIGALIFFSLLTGFCIYLTIVVIKRGNKTETEAVEELGDDDFEGIPFTTPVSAPQAVPMQPQAPPTAERMPTPPVYGGHVEPKVPQQPGVTFSDTPMQPTPLGEMHTPQSQGQSFSPFGAPQTATRKTPQAQQDEYARSREFLFSFSPEENFRRNLIFDPNANVNKRPPVEADQPQMDPPTSYVESYERYVNDGADSAMPTKVVTDTTQPTYGRNVETNPYGDYASPNYSSNTSSAYGQPTRSSYYGQEQSIPNNDSFATPQTPYYPVNDSPQTPFEGRSDTPIQPIEPYSYDFNGRTNESYRGVEEETPAREWGRGVENEQQEEKPLPVGREDGYRRHDYMDLFSTSNPNIFGGADVNTDSPFARETRGDERGGYYEDVPQESTPFGERETEEQPRRDGLNIFDEEPEDDPYRLRSDFEERQAPMARDIPTPTREERSDRRDSTEELFTEERGGRNITPQEETPISSRFTRETPPAPAPTPAPPAPKKPRVIKPYVRMRLDDLDCRDIEPTANADEVERTKEDIIATLEDFKVTGATIASVTFGPTVTRYNVTLPRSISPKKVVALDQSISISLHSSGVNIYPNYEDGVVSIEVPNKERQFVQLGCMLSGDSYVNAKPSSIMFAMGKDVANHKVYGDISKMIHLLVAGASGSGKSVFLGALIISLIYKYSPQELRLILIDPKKTEFVLYNDLPHLMINEIITDVNKTVQSLNWAIEEMNRRYGLFEQMSRSGTYVVNLDQYNEQLKPEERLPKIVIIIDELADLMLAAKKEMEDRIQNLTQKARAAGIHLIVATQRPSTDVITGVIKSNLPTRIAFGVATDVDSRVILDQTGAQKLLGKGDFLYTMSGINTPVRVQSAFISPEESQRVVNFIKANNEAYYDEEATAYINNSKGNTGDSSARTDKNNVEPVYIDALRYVIISGSASISMIQRKCSAGYNKAGKIIEWMEDMGYISPFDGAKARKVLITKEEFEEKYGPL